MTSSFFFYDLETSGINPRKGRVMQFAGQRTDMELKPIGEPHNYLVKMTEDVLPSPEAIMITGITPQQTLADGLTEAEFLKIFQEEIAAPGTIFVGYNTVRFDDEFMRYMHYRNFYDPFKWQWRDSRTKWDLLDVVRMTRALRPEGIKWPKDKEGKSVNKLELIAELNELSHENAHDALSDVLATIELAKLIKQKQPKLFEYLLGIRGKKPAAKLISGGQPFVYSSGKYDHKYEKTTVVGLMSEHPGGQGAVVFDLRYSPRDFIDKSAEELVDALRYKPKDENTQKFPAKTIKFNRCPAIAPLGVLDESSQKRLDINLDDIKKNYQQLQKMKNILGEKFDEAVKVLDKEREVADKGQEKSVDERLYDGFFSDQDKRKMSLLRNLSQKELSEFSEKFDDSRLNELLPLYKARNFPKSLTESERVVWDNFRESKLIGGEPSEISKFMQSIAQLYKDVGLSEQKKFLLEELKLYAESILPAAD